MRSLVIGFGSIGQRHARLLAEAGHDVAVVSTRPIDQFRHYSKINAAIHDFQPDFCLIASITSRHGQDLNELESCGFAGKVLVEKPLLNHADDFAHKPQFPFVGVAYNLRFHGVIRALKPILAGQKILCAHLYAGQHLSQWRPNRPVKDCYSAWKEQGGGVVRDLSHELDLAQYMFGPLTHLASHTIRAGQVTMDSEDLSAILLRAENCPLVSIHLNYLDHQPCRLWRVLTESQTIEADLIKGTIAINGEITHIPLLPDETYKMLHLAALDQDRQVCTWDEGLSVVHLISRIAP